MAFIIRDRVKEGTTSTGTGAITLGGAAATFDPFNSYMTNGDTTYYAIVHTSTGVDEWEVGLGTWNTGNTLTRTTVLAGSNGTSAVNFSAGNKDVFMTYPAAHAALAGDDVNFANITVTGTVDGRDVAADGTKLDTIETNADVTDAVNVAAAGALMKSGGTMTGNLILNADPTAALGAATKEYVDTIASAGIHYHDPVRVETPSALTASYNNGSSGVGATLTNSGTQAALVIDGVTMALNDRVLVYNQTDETHNGIYTVTNVGSASTNWVMTRATDADSYGASDPDSFGKGDAFFVKEGNTGAGELYVMTTAGTITFGTTAIHFSQVAETAVYNAGTGITLTGTTFSIGQDVATTANVTFNQVTADIIGNVTGNLTGDVTGNADTATALETARTIQLSGDVTGSATFDGSANINITAAVQDDSHAHVISNVDGLQAALDGKTPTTRTITAGNGLTGGGDLSANRTFNVGAGTGVTVNADTVAIGQDVGTTADVTFNQVTADNLRIGDWTGGDAYAAVSHSSQTGDEYMMINNDGHTYISASTGSEVYIRGGNNASAYQIVVSPTGYATAAGSTIITEAGSGLSKSSRTLSHADTSSQASVNNSNGTVIQDITLDTYGHITGINSVNLDSRYYTESEADSRFVNIGGDGMTGRLSPDTPSDYDQTAITSLTNAPIYYPEVNVGSSDTYLPAFHMRALHSGGYRTHMNVGLHKDSSGWGGSSTGFYVALGGNDSNPTEAYKLTYGGEINHTVAGRFFADNYHPNADKWTTARTLTLSGDASGSVSWDGSANATLSVTVANDSHTHNKIVALGNYVWSASTNARDFTDGIQASFVRSADGYPEFGSVVRINTYDNDGGGAELYFPYGSAYGGTAMRYRLGQYNNAGWTSWKTVVDTSNIGSYAWTSSNDGSGSGLDADKLDGYHLSTTRNSANTVPVRDSDGYLQLGWINTTSGSTTSTINKIYASYDNYIRYITPGTLISQLGLVTSTNITNSTDSLIGKARSLGWYPAYGSAVESNVQWNDAEEAVALYNSSDTSIGMAFKAVYAKKGQQIRFTVPIKSSAAASDSLYLRIYAHGGNLPDGKFAVSNSATHPNVQEEDYTDNGWYESGAHTTSWRNFERTYVMPADGYVSVVILNWSNFSGTVYAKQPDIQMVSDFTYEDSNRNIRFETNSTDGAGGITLQSSDGDFQFQLYGDGSTKYGFLDSNWGSWDIQKVLNGEMYLNGSLNYYLQPEATSKLYNLIIDEKIRWHNSVATDDDRGIYFHDSGSDYAIFREEGAWSDPYPDLVIGFHTGIKIGGFTGYGGTRFYSDAPKKSGATEIMSVGDGDTNVRVANDLLVGASLTLGSGVTLEESTDRADLLQITSSTGDWGGIQIRNSSNEGRWSFMTDGNIAGIYDEENGDWHMQMTENGGVTLYANGTANFTTGTTYMEMSRHLDMNNYDIYGVDQIRHHGDTNTYMNFHASDQWRVVVGGTERLEVKNSSPHVLVTGDLNSTSDERLKENVESIANALSDITQLEGVSFDWKDTGTRGHGFIAQQVEPILPDVVQTDDETGIKSINYVGMMGHLVEAIKELKAEIDELKR